MKIVLCDDNKAVSEELGRLIKKFGEENRLQNEFLYFSKPSLLFEYMQEEPVDLIFMDFAQYFNSGYLLFFRCHSKYLVNLAHVTKFENQVLTLGNGEKIPVSRRKWKAFQLAYMKFDTRDYRL